MKFFPWVLWTIWKNRNQLFFKGNCYWPPNTIKKINDESSEWFMAQTEVFIVDQSQSVCGIKRPMEWKFSTTKLVQKQYWKCLDQKQESQWKSLDSYRLS